MAETMTPPVETPEAINPLDAPDEDFLRDDAPTAGAPAGHDQSDAATPPPAGEGQPSGDAPSLTVDSAGRYHRSDGTMASADEIEKFKATNQEAKPTPSPEGVVASGGQPPAQPEATKASPFKYRADGSTHEVEGSEVREDGSIVWPAANVPELRQLLAAGRAAAPVYQRLNAVQQELQQEREKRGEKEVRAEALTGAFREVLNERDPQRALESFSKLWQDWPQRVAKAEVEYWKSQAERGSAQPSAVQQNGAPQQQNNQPASPTYPTPEVAMGELTDAIEAAKLDHAYRALSAEDWKQLSQRLTRNPYAFVRPVTADEAKQYGMTPGEVAFDMDALTTALTEYTTSKTQQSESQKKAAQLAADNARRTQPSVSAPPVAGKGAAPPGKPKGFASKDDVDDYWNSDEA